MSKLVFVLDDEKDWQNFALEALVEDQTIEVETFSSMAAIRARVRRTEPDLFILDWTLPEQSGLAVLRMVREEFTLDTPVIMLTRREDSDDIVNALNRGADDYLTKPAVPAILLARSRALLRRSQLADRKTDFEDHGGVTFDLRSQTTNRVCNGEALTSKEFALALLLFRTLGSPVSRETIFLKVWHTEPSLQSRTIDAHIAHIRRKLRLRPSNGFLLSSVYGYGYRLEQIERAP